MSGKNKEQNNVEEQNQNEVKEDNGNTVRSSSGPNVDRLIVAVGICVTLLVLAKLLGL